MQKRSVVNQKEFRVVGLSRSGSHAIIQWISEQQPGRVCFLNCVEPRTNPFHTARPLDDGRRALASYSSFRLSREAAGKLSRKDLLVYSYEDCFLGSVCHREFEEARERMVGSSGRRCDLVILRDPFNLFASRMHSRYGGVTPATSVRIWKQHARQFLGHRTCLTGEFVPVNFNRWAREKAYRRKLAALLDLEFTDSGLLTVPEAGGGSSFDRRAFDGRANRMNIVGRWRHFTEDAQYRKLFDDEVLELSDAIFGSIENNRHFASFRSQLGGSQTRGKTPAP